MFVLVPAAMPERMHRHKSRELWHRERETVKDRFSSLRWQVAKFAEGGTPGLVFLSEDSVVARGYADLLRSPSPLRSLPVLRSTPLRLSTPSQLRLSRGTPKSLSTC
jgi:hypothetical protein